MSDDPNPIKNSGSSQSQNANSLGEGTFPLQTPGFPRQNSNSGPNVTSTTNKSAPLQTSPQGKTQKEDIKNIFAQPPVQKKPKNTGALFAVLGTIFLTSSIACGVILVQKQQYFSLKALKNKKTIITNAYASCNKIRVYDKNWQLLSYNQLKLLETGEAVFLTIKCSATSGNFDMAIFTINGQPKEATTTKNKASDEFFLKYEIPQEVKTFKIEAQVHHSELGWF